MELGMKKILKLGVVTSFLVIGACFVFSNPTQANISLAETVTSPRSLYVQNCARCHGSNGKSQTDLGKKLEADDISGGQITASKIIRTVTNGRKEMPSFRKKLSAAQIKSIAGYVHSL